MNDLHPSLVNECKKYITYQDNVKRKLLSTLYNEHGLSWQAIGELTDTYANKVRRDAKRLGITSRDKSDAQKTAISSGRHPHPTKDKGHSEESKIKISDSVAAAWENMPEEQRQAIRDDSKERWESKSADEIKSLREAAGAGVRRAAKEGSELEKYLLKGLSQNGFKVHFHKEQFVVREKLQIDLFLPELNVAIEVDGPTHFEDIWGEELLRKNQQRDWEKSGLLLQKGMCVIRIRQNRALSQKYKRDVLKFVCDKLNEIKENFPPVGEREILWT